MTGELKKFRVVMMKNGDVQFQDDMNAAYEAGYELLLLSGPQYGDLRGPIVATFQLPDAPKEVTP